MNPKKKSQEPNDSADLAKMLDRILEAFTITELLELHGKDGKPLLASKGLEKPQITKLLNRSTCEDPIQIKQIEEILSKEFPKEATAWAKRQIEHLQKKTSQT